MNTTTTLVAPTQPFASTTMNHSIWPTFSLDLTRLLRSRQLLIVAILYVVIEFIFFFALMGEPLKYYNQPFSIQRIVTCIASLILSSVVILNFMTDRRNAGLDPVTTTPLSPLGILGGKILLIFLINTALQILSLPVLLKIVSLNAVCANASDIVPASVPILLVSNTVQVLLLTVAVLAGFLFLPMPRKQQNRLPWIQMGGIQLTIILIGAFLSTYGSSMNALTMKQLLLDLLPTICYTLAAAVFILARATMICLPPRANRFLLLRFVVLTEIFVILPLITYMLRELCNIWNFTSYSYWMIPVYIVLIFSLGFSTEEPLYPSQRTLAHTKHPWLTLPLLSGPTGSMVFHALVIGGVYLIYMTILDRHLEGTAAISWLFYVAIVSYFRTIKPEANSFFILVMTTLLFTTPVYILFTLIDSDILMTLTIGGYPDTLYDAPYGVHILLGIMCLAIIGLMIPNVKGLIHLLRQKY